MSRYHDHGDGTITDADTGLIWQSNTPGQKMTWDEAKHYADSLRLAGYKWRVPTIYEFMRLIDFDRYNPATEVPNTVAGGYWSSSTYAYNANYAWHVGFYYGSVNTSYKTITYYVRCVQKEGKDDE